MGCLYTNDTPDKKGCGAFMHINTIDYTSENLNIEQWMRNSTITSLGRELVKAGISLRGRTHFPGLDPSLIQLASISSKEVERTKAWRKNLSRIRIEEVLRAAAPTLANAREIKINRDFMFAQAKKLADQKGVNVGPRELTAASFVTHSRYSALVIEAGKVDDVVDVLWKLGATQPFINEYINSLSRRKAATSRLG